MAGIGQQLKEARESRGLSIKQVVQATRIRAYYLEAMEADDFSAMPSAAQARGFLRSYADFLGLNAEELINRQRNEAASVVEFTAPVQTEPPAPVQTPSTVEVPEPQLEAASPTTAGPVAQDKLTDYSAETPPLQPEPTPLEPEPEPEGEEELRDDSAAIEPPAAPSASRSIFAEIGNALRQRRELLSLTLDEIERHTHVRKYYLEVIEQGLFDELPSPVQARGMLSNYSSFLDMDTEATLLRFADALQARRLERQADLPPISASSRRRIGLPFWLRRFVSPDLLFGGGMIVLLFFLTVWGATRIFSEEIDQLTQTPVLSIPDVLLASPVAVTTLAAETTQEILPTSVQVEPVGGGEALETATETATADPSLGVKVTISAVERAFVRVVVDGVIEYEGRVAPGYAQTFDGQDRIEVLTGSGSAIQVLFNQRSLGPMGNFGEVVNLVYTINGIQTPTMTPSMTPSPTPLFQKTVTPTPTLTPTPTATLTQTATPLPTPTALPTDSQ